MERFKTLARRGMKIVRSTDLKTYWSGCTRTAVITPTPLWQMHEFVGEEGRNEEKAACVPVDKPLSQAV